MELKVVFGHATGITGIKKKKVCIKILLKMDFGLNGLRMEINT
jgi:hypothetical protein